MHGQGQLIHSSAEARVSPYRREMAESSSQTAVTFLTAPIGGGVIALLMWFFLKGPCQLAGFDTECVTVGDQTFFNPGGLMTIGAGVGLVLAAGVALFRHLNAPDN